MAQASTLCLIGSYLLDGGRGKVPVTESPSPFSLQVSDRFFPYSTIRTDAILSLDARSSLSTSEVRAGPKRSPVWVDTARGPQQPLRFPGLRGPQVMRSNLLHLKLPQQARQPPL